MIALASDPARYQDWPTNYNSLLCRWKNIINKNNVKPANKNTSILPNCKLSVAIKLSGKLKCIAQDVIQRGAITITEAIIAVSIHVVGVAPVSRYRMLRQIPQTQQIKNSKKAIKKITALYIEPVFSYTKLA